jgi:Tol biopolymer transport system component
MKQAGRRIQHFRIFAPNAWQAQTVFKAISMKQRFTFWVLVASLGVLSACDKTDPSESNDLVNDPIVNTSDQLVYTANTSGTFQIWKQTPELELLTTDSEHDCWWPRVHPDGSKLLYYSATNGRDINDYASADLWVMDLDGENAALLIPSGSHGWTQQGLANWSIDGTMITLAAVDSMGGSWQIYICNADGSDPVKVSLRNDVDYLDPIFGPDQNSIICVSIPEGMSNDESHYEIMQISLADGSETRLTNNQRRDQHPALSPSGNTIVYESLVDPGYLSIGKWSLMMSNLQSGNETILLDNDHINLFPRFTNAGEHIVYTQLNVNSFAMSVHKLEQSSGASTPLIKEDGHSMNADPF